MNRHPAGRRGIPLAEDVLDHGPWHEARGRQAPAAVGADGAPADVKWFGLAQAVDRAADHRGCRTSDPGGCAKRRHGDPAGRTVV